MVPLVRVHVALELTRSRLGHTSMIDDVIQANKSRHGWFDVRVGGDEKLKNYFAWP